MAKSEFPESRFEKITRKFGWIFSPLLFLTLVALTLIIAQGLQLDSMGNIEQKGSIHIKELKDGDFYVDGIKVGRTTWDGVHNFQAIATIKKMKVGDKAYIYHSQTDKAIVGLAKVVSAPEENKKDKRTSWVVDIEFVKRYKDVVTLAEIKEVKDFSDFLLIRNGRLSVMEVPKKIVDWLEKKLK